jgi:YVTN family beta-propeller protein
MKTGIPLTSLYQNKSHLSYAILLLLSVSLMAATGSTQVLHYPSSAAKISGPSNTLSATIALGAGVFPQAVVVSPNSQTIYVASSISGSSLISVVDSQTNTVTTTIPLAGGLNDLAISPDGSTLYALSLGNPAAVYVIATASNTVTSTVNVEGIYLAISPNGDYVYVTNGKPGISIIDTATNQVEVNAIKPRGVSQYIALNPDGKTAYVGIIDAVVVIDLATKKVKATIRLTPTNALPTYLTVSPDGKKFFIDYEYGRPAHNYILVADNSTNDVTKTIRVQRHASAYSQEGITPDGKYLYIPFSEISGGEIVVLDTDTNRLEDDITLDIAPVALAVAPTAPFACAIGIYGNNDEGELEIIDISPE